MESELVSNMAQNVRDEIIVATVGFVGLIYIYKGLEDISLHFRIDCVQRWLSSHVCLSHFADNSSTQP